LSQRHEAPRLLESRRRALDADEAHVPSAARSGDKGWPTTPRARARRSPWSSRRRWRPISRRTATDRLEAALARRLDWTSRQIERLERHVSISNEALAMFVGFWLTSTRPLPDTALASARDGQRRARSGWSSPRSICARAR